MFEKELQTYLKAAASVLPCAEARTAFETYVRGVAQDVCSAASEESFTAVAAQLGTDRNRLPVILRKANLRKR